MKPIIACAALVMASACSHDPSPTLDASSLATAKHSPAYKTPNASTPSTSVTAMDQPNKEADVNMTQEIRRALVDDSTLSVQAKNLTVVSKDGVVTLRGVVPNEEEKSRIVSIAEAVVGVQRVESEIQIEPH